MRGRAPFEFYPCAAAQSTYGTIGLHLRGSLVLARSAGVPAQSAWSGTVQLVLAWSSWFRRRQSGSGAVWRFIKSLQHNAPTLCRPRLICALSAQRWCLPLGGRHHQAFFACKHPHAVLQLFESPYFDLTHALAAHFEFL